MKKILFAVMLMLGLGIISSCEKGGNGDGDNSLVGTWESQGGAGSVHQSISSVKITSSTITMNYRSGSDLYQKYGASKTVNYIKGEPYEKAGTVFQKIILNEPLFRTDMELFYIIESNSFVGTMLTLYTTSFDINLFFSKK